MPIEIWFPTVIFFEDITIPEDVREGAMAAVEESIDHSALDSKKRYTAADAAHTLHLDDRIQGVLGLLAPAMKQFFYEDLHIDKSTTFHVGRCWPVVQTAGGIGEWHFHAGAQFSGVFYLNTPKGSGGLEFKKPFRSTYDYIQKSENTAITYDNVTYPPIQNRLVLFSSDILHRGQPNTEPSDEPRVAIAFDIYSIVTIEDRQGGLPPATFLKPIA